MTFGAGDRIGDYEVLAPLGAGGMGSVYKVRHAISQRVEALKIILPNAPATPEIAERFLREIRLLASLEQPHIASLRTAFRFQDELVMVMEFVEGVSLREKLHSPGITLGSRTVTGENEASGGSCSMSRRSRTCRLHSCPSSRPRCTSLSGAMTLPNSMEKVSTSP